MSIYYTGNFQRVFGTWPLRGDAAHAAIETAIATGYRAFDTAQGYENEAEVGAALAGSGVVRDDLCITTKVKQSNFGPDRFIASVEQSLRDLQVDKVDVLLLHWPVAGGDIGPSLLGLQKAYDLGLTRNIGISNYTIAMMETALEILDAPIVTNQVEFHPLLDQSKLLAAASRLGIPLSSYCSVARGEVFNHAIFAEIGAEYDKTPGQIVLRWILQNGVSINTMSRNPVNIAANYAVMDFTLSNVDMARITALNQLNYRIVTKEIVSDAPDWD